jgi:hypothetical protein
MVETQCARSSACLCVMDLVCWAARGLMSLSLGVLKAWYCGLVKDVTIERKSCGIYTFPEVALVTSKV